MPFPVTARYFLNFRNSDTGLTPTFVFFQRADTFGATSPASPVGGIVEKSNGEYYFDWTWSTKTDPDIVFEVDGGASIPTEEVRYIKGTISPRDRFTDEPVSQVVTDVWTDNTAYSAGQKGKRVDDIGAPTDTSAAATVFGKTKLYEESVKGVDNRNLTEMAGTGFNTTTDSLKVISDNIDTINLNTSAASISNAVWNELISSHQTAGSMGRVLNDVFRVLKNKAIINATTKQLEIYDDAGVSIVFVFDLKDEFGVASATRIFQRLP